MATEATGRQNCILIWDFEGRSLYGSTRRQLDRRNGAKIKEMYICIETISEGMVLPVSGIPRTFQISYHCLGSLCSRPRIRESVFGYIQSLNSLNSTHLPRLCTLQPQNEYFDISKKQRIDTCFILGIINSK